MAHRSLLPPLTPLPTPVFDAAPFVRRRQQVLAEMHKKGRGVAIIPTSAELIRNRDTHHPFRFDSNFWYLTGFEEPDAVLVLLISDTPQSLLFCRPKHEERELWEGFRFGPDAARERFAFDAAYPLEDLDRVVSEHLIGAKTLWHSLGTDGDWDARVGRWLEHARAQSRAGKQAPTVVADWRALVEPMRRSKDAGELILMQRAADIAVNAHCRTMQASRPGLYEYQLDAELHYAFLQAGGHPPSYPAIIAGGSNACILHYTANNQPLRDGELVLIDAGCEVSGYASDITRTFPVNGRFSPAQRDLYAITLAAHDAALAATRPGAAFHAPHDAAVRVLVQGMIDLGLCQGSVEGVIESGDFRRFYMHRTSHWLGLDVHDAGPYHENEEWVSLQSGMTLTIEPGFYVRAADDVPVALHNIGIRIEDDVVVNDDGCHVMTAAAPTTIEAIESLMANPS
ncbi:MAG: aminopeptidase P N-terminal domain-containing protein [Fluviibacter sp.]